MDSFLADRATWTSLMDSIRSVVTRQQFETWFRTLRFVRSEPGEVTVSVPNGFHREWIDSYYIDMIQDQLRQLTGSSLRVQLEIEKAGGQAEPPRAPAPSPRAPQQSASGTDASDRHDGGRNRSDNLGTYSQGTPHEADKSSHDKSSQWQPQSQRPAAGRRSNSRRRGKSSSFHNAHTELFGHPRYPNFLSDVILNEDYLFANFLTGPSNHLAHAAALAVANAPAQEYNPLFLHGGVGLGKTHLLQAICARVLSRRPDAKILYLSCESFVNQFISGVEAGGLADFRYRYRHVDMLLIDDIHFLARKERTSEEFFHTFNTLYNSRKQIVLSCDSPPREIPTLEERLVSRFKWGLVTQILPPDHETRVSIVRRKAERKGIQLSDEVSLLIADHIRSNVRELEGAVLRVLGYASLSGKELTLELAEEALRDIIEPRERKISIESIIRTVSEVYGVKVSELMGRRRHKSISLPRQVCMYLARQLTEYSLVEIGGQLGGRDHTTVIYATEKISRELGNNARLKEDLDSIVRSLRSGS